MSDPNLDEKQRRAAELRLAGATFQQIADVLGYAHRAAAQKAVRAGMALTEVEDDGEREDPRALELARLDSLQSSMWSRAKNGDPTYVGLVLKVMAQRARLLGLDASAMTVPAGPVERGGDVIDDLAARRAARLSSQGS